MGRRRGSPLAGPCAVSGVAALAIALALAGAGAGGALADRNTATTEPGALRDAANRYEISIAPGWRPLAPPAGTLVACATEGGRGHLAVTRVEAGTRHVRDPEALAGQVERGVARATRGFRRVRRRLSRSSRAAALDLSYERAGEAGRELVLTRYLFFSKYTVVLSIGLGPGAARADRRAAEAMVRSFAPLE